jgi:hypothetical protein
VTDAELEILAKSLRVEIADLYTGKKSRGKG